MSHPWLKFYPRDWRGDQALRAVSIGARGLWIEMLCIMHEASPYGHLILGGRAVSNDVLARVAGLGADECGALVAELESAGVLSRTRKGVIYSRRMVKDHSRAEKGRKSVNKRWSQKPEEQGEKGTPNRLPSSDPTTQKPEARGSEDKSSGGEPPPNPAKQMWDLGRLILMEAGVDEGRARQLVGKWRKAKKDDGAVLTGLLECQAKAIEDPVSWLEKRFQSAKWTSPKGHEYRGTDEEVMKEAERRNDMTTYWAVRAEIGRRKKAAA